MKTLNKTQKMTIVAGAFFLCAAGLYWYAYNGVLMRERIHMEKQDEWEQRYTAYQKQKLQTIFEKKTEEERARLEKYFVDKDNPTGFLADVENAATAAGAVLTVQSLSEYVDQEGGAHEQKYMVLTTTINGTWEGLYDTISAIETLPYAISVHSFILQHGKEEGGDAWEGNLTLHVGMRS